MDDLMQQIIKNIFFRLIAQRSALIYMNTVGCTLKGNLGNFVPMSS